LQNSASFGIVGGIGRQVAMPNGRHEEIIQTDAVINGGNSGGPLIDIFGQVIGVNFASTDSAKGVSGISYAISTELVRDVVPEIIKYGGVKRASIGVSVTARRHKKDHGFETAIEVTKCNISDSPLKPGDIILTLNGTQIRRRYDLIRLLNREMIDSVVEIEVVRSGQSVKIEAQVAAK
jgi:S1-C subfamily serine protease